MRPTAPEGFEIRVAGSGAFTVRADPQEVFRILFNLMRNAITAARRALTGTMTHVTLLVACGATTVTVRIADDGPGLPKSVRENLFRAQPGARRTGNGFGLAIARELAERNGGVLELAKSARGTTFVLELAAFAGMPSRDAGALRPLGRRVENR